MLGVPPDGDVEDLHQSGALSSEAEAGSRTVRCRRSVAVTRDRDEGEKEQEGTLVLPVARPEPRISGRISS
jgi:hypothetical protein